MIARKKVVPPVTPRIVPTHHGRRRIQYVLLVCAFLLTAWFSYDFGRHRAPVSGDAPVTQSAESEQRIKALEQERDALKQQVAKLKQHVEQGEQALGVARARIQTLQQAKPSPREASAPSPVPEPATPDATEPADGALNLENVQIVATESENIFRVRFSVMHGGDRTGRVTGTIWIAVNGFSNGVPRRLSFKALSPDRRSYVKMDFDRQQDVTEDLVLPENFRPKNVLIEAKPYIDKYIGTTEKVAWAASE